MHTFGSHEFLRIISRKIIKIDMEDPKIMYLQGHPLHRLVPCEMRTTAFFQPPHQKKQSTVCVLETLDTFKIEFICVS